MSEDTAMNEAELRQAVESMRAQIAALSGRIDGLDRGEILRGVNDGRRDKLAERHAQAFGRHSGDGVAHHYRDYMNPHKIPGMKEVRVFEDAETIESFVMSSAEYPNSYGSSDPDAGSALMTTAFNMDDSVINANPATQWITLVAGTYAISLSGGFAFRGPDIGSGRIYLVEKDGVTAPDFVSYGLISLDMTFTPSTIEVLLNDKNLRGSVLGRIVCTKTVNMRLDYEKSGYMYNIGSACVHIIRMA